MQTYTLIRSKKRRRSATLRVIKGGEIVVRAPVFMPKFMIDKFVSSHQVWIDKQIKKVNIPTKPKVQLRTKDELEEFVKDLITKYEKITGLYSSSLRFRSVKTYWGSCSPSGVISFNTHLVYAPSEAVEYVVVHELCHLRYRGHGPRFWALVHKYFPRANEMRKVLRQIGRE